MLLKLFRYQIMESQVTKSKISNEAKDETDKKRKGFLKKDSFRNVKESIEENDVIIISIIKKKWFLFNFGLICE